MQIATWAVAFSTAGPRPLLSRIPLSSFPHNKPPTGIHQMHASAEHPRNFSDFAAGTLLWRPPARFECATSPPRRSHLTGRFRPAPTQTRAPRNGARAGCHVSCHQPMKARQQACGGVGCDAGGRGPVSPAKRAAILARWTTRQAGSPWSYVIAAAC